MNDPTVLAKPDPLPSPVTVGLPRPLECSVSSLIRSSASLFDTTGRSTVTNKAFICGRLLTTRNSSSVFDLSLLMYN